MYNVCILLSAYNGEQYIEKQIIDILNQDNCNIQLIIRDDGSTDRTLNIITGLSEKYSNITIIQGENIGWRKSFMELVSASKNTEAEYYAFSDQDDEWDSNKLVSSICYLEKKRNMIPALYGSNLRIKRNGIVERGYLFSESQCRDGFAKNFLIGSSPFGCSMVWNRNLNSLVANNLPSIEVCHDIWMHMIARLFGDVYIDYDAHMTHVIHGNNACGVSKSVFERMKKFFQIYMSENYVPCSEYISEIDRIWGVEKTRYTDKEFLNNYINYKSNFKSKLLLLKSDFVRQLQGRRKLRFVMFVLIRKA